MVGLFLNHILKWIIVNPSVSFNFDGTVNLFWKPKITPANHAPSNVQHTLDATWLRSLQSKKARTRSSRKHRALFK